MRRTFHDEAVGIARDVSLVDERDHLANIREDKTSGGIRGLPGLQVDEIRRSRRRHPLIFYPYIMGRHLNKQSVSMADEAFRSAGVIMPLLLVAFLTPALPDFRIMEDLLRLQIKENNVS